MRRRADFDVWPAFADLMTVVAVVALFATLGLAQSIQNQSEKLDRLERELREASKNKEMFQAIQSAQSFVDDFSRNQGLEFSADQSLQFGDELVSYALNGVEPVWHAGSREKLTDFCQALSSEFEKNVSGLGPLRDLFTVQVEGHTDSTSCPEDPHCNWRFSSARAAVFVALMKQEEFCPGGKPWAIRPIGFADSRPIKAGDGQGAGVATRRMAIRLIPNYKEIISRSRAG